MARILVVDDEPDILLLMRVLLETAGHETVLAADAERAMERLETEAVDLVLLDVRMPVQDGWTVLRALPQSAETPRVVVVSARAGSSDVRRAFELGAVDFLRKPFEPDELKQVVDAALSRTEEELAAYRRQVLGG